jgi:GNAT superfamily N-acetyltransferase
VIPGLEIQPLIWARWQDFEKLFGPRGACGGCWCMYWKYPRKDFQNNRGDGNRSLQTAFVETGGIPGLLAYVEGLPVGWCAIEPRENFPTLERSPILQPVDDSKVWSITCFFVDRKFRLKGLSTALLLAAVQYAAENDARIVEGYPTDQQDKQMPAPFVYTGLAKSFFASRFRRGGSPVGKTPDHALLHQIKCATSGPQPNSSARSLLRRCRDPYAHPTQVKSEVFQVS